MIGRHNPIAPMIAVALCGAGLAGAAQQPHPPRAAPGGVRSSLYTEDWEPGYRDDRGRFLQDFSYAGYHNGESPLPGGNHSRTFDVTWARYGADRTGKQDATAAIQKAIDDAAAAGAGIVYVPAGTYRLSERLHVERSRIVLRGAGSHGERSTRLLFENGGRQLPSILFGSEAQYGAKRPLAKDADIFDRHLVLEDVAGLARGDHFIVACRITGQFLKEHHMEEFWGVNQKNRIRHFFRRRIARVDPAGKRVFFKVPIRYPMRTRDHALVMKTTGLVEECGIEHLAVSNATREEKDAWDAHPGWPAVRMLNVTDCWARDVHSFESPDCPPFHLRSFGINIECSKQVTIADCELARPQNRGGRGNGYLYSLSASNEILVRDCTGRNGRHNFSSGRSFGNSGNVFLRVHTAGGTGFYDWKHREAVLRGQRKPWPNMASDYHMQLSIACLVDDSVIDDAWSARNRGSMSSSSGHTATQCVFWNNRGKGEIRSFQYGWGYVIGTEALGVRTTAKQARPSGNCRSDEGTTPFDFTEHIGAGAQLSVRSLYEDQLARRLKRRGPLAGTTSPKRH